ncbi:hypothetical protein TSAR_005158 [Trichomalopsis sarcophagae]|uniref:Uncharacterized protein n=1 Tax=Trichomalopsis sarcophagae TaxID=543379 RepID=A0A232F7F7_9HYME|nr:hypothetical protein TSAR_005158 [Trichomalopsis sarcophagae]
MSVPYEKLSGEESSAPPAYEDVQPSRRDYAHMTPPPPYIVQVIQQPTTPAPLPVQQQVVVVNNGEESDVEDSCCCRLSPRLIDRQRNRGKMSDFVNKNATSSNFEKSSDPDDEPQYHRTISVMERPTPAASAFDTTKTEAQSRPAHVVVVPPN